MQRRPGPAASSSASTTGHSERVSDSTSASSSNSPRASMIAVPCSPIEPDSRIRSPGRSAARAEAARAGPGCPTPVVARYIWSAWPRSTTLVSPDTISTPAAVAARAIASTSARSTSASRPSSRIIASVSASGRAPAIARSLTVPLTASSPIEPPGKRSGLTTNESVVTTMSPAARAVRELGHPEGGREQALDQRLRRLAAGPVGHRDRGVLEARPLGAGGLDDPEDPLLTADDARHAFSRANRP